MHRWVGPVIVALAASVSPAQAHHSLAGYDQSKLVTLEGLVTEFRYANPHPFLIITVNSGPGAPQAWRLEMDNLYELDEIGVFKDTFKPRDRVLVRGNPDRSRSGELYLRRLDRPSDGLRYEQVGFSPRVNFRPK